VADTFGKFSAGLEDTILENAQGSAEARGDAVSMRQHPLPDQIEADKYLVGGAVAVLRLPRPPAGTPSPCGNGSVIRRKT
jgi:hypothetical protein